jgi:glutamate-5-semialdehyde dehydrogenase
MSTLAADMLELGRRARAAARDVAMASAETRTAALHAMAKHLRNAARGILKANAEDIATARTE